MEAADVDRGNCGIGVQWQAARVEHTSCPFLSTVLQLLLEDTGCQ